MQLDQHYSVRPVILMMLFVIIVFLSACDPPDETPTPTTTPTLTPKSSQTPTPTFTTTPTSAVGVTLFEKFEMFAWVAYTPTQYDPNSDLVPTAEQIVEDLQVLYDAGFRGIVTYGADGILSQIPTLAREVGFEGVVMGIWTPNDPEETDAALQAVAEVDGFVVGNEGVFFDRYDMDTLEQAIVDLRASSEKPVTTSEVLSLYYTEEKLMSLGDWVFPNAHPYWAGITNPEEAFIWTIEQYNDLALLSNDLSLVFKEVGLPTGGESDLSKYQQAEYFNHLRESDIMFMYFEAFDQFWKVEDGVGQYWGLFNTDRSPKVAGQYIERGFPPIYVYTDYGASYNYFVPEGFMGCWQGIDVDENDQSNPYSGTSSIKISYAHQPSCADEWAGIFWWPPNNNWCEEEGIDLAGRTRVTFWVRGEEGGENVEFKVGGLRPCDSILPEKTTHPFELSNEWEQKTITITGRDLSQVAGGFVWVTNSEEPITIYLDEIRFEWSEETNFPSSTPTLTPIPSTINPSPTATLIPPTKTMTSVPPTATLSPTITSSPTHTPLPTSTPLAFAKSDQEESLIIIFPFYTAEGIRDDLPHRIIYDALEDKASELDIENLRLEIYPETLTDGDLEKALEIGNFYDASMIIWGDQTGIKIVANLLNLKRLEDEVFVQSVSIQETERTQSIASPNVYSHFLLEDLPSRVTFYSLFSLAQEKGFQSNYEESFIILERVINELADTNVPSEDLGSAYYYLAWLLSQIEPLDSDLIIENYNKAIELYSEAISLNPQASAYSSRGFVLYFMEEYEEAFADFNIAIELEPENAHNFYNRGKIHSAQGNDEAALSDYTKAIEINPEFIFAYFYRGRIYHDLRQNGAASADFEKAIELNPQVAYFHLNLGLVNHDLGEYEAAITNYYEAIKLDPNYAYAYLSRGRAYHRLEEYQSAINDFSQVIELDPNYVSAYHSRGRTYHSLEEYENAIVDFSQAIELDSNYVSAYHSRAISYEALSKYDEAIFDYTQIITLNPDNDSAYFNRSLAFDKLGDYSNAILDLAKSLELVSTYNYRYRFDYFTYLAATNASIGQYDATIAYLTEATILAPYSAQAFNDLCWWGSLLGKVDEVFYACEEAITRTYDFDEGRFHSSRGLARALKGDYTGAIEDFNAYVEWSKENNQYETYGIKREAWIIQLEAGNSPFDEKTLEDLRNE